MPVQTIVGDPELIRTRKQADSYLSRIIAYEQERKCEGGVLLIFNKQVGGRYRIKSIEEAKEYMEDPTRCEIGIQFFHRSYFENLKGTLEDDFDEE